MADLTLKNLIKNIYFILTIIMCICIFGIKYIISGPLLSIITLIMSISTLILLITAFITESKKPQNPQKKKN